MKTQFIQLTGALLLGAALTAAGAVRYVNLNNPTPASPFTEWSTAATNIQDAIDVAAAGEEIVVTNGVYETGGRVVYGTLTNRVAVTKPVTVRSVNGPAVTIIKGYQVPSTTNGAAAIRCVYLTNGAVLAGFTLTNGATQTSGDSGKQRSGGGVWCESTSAVVINCVLARNSASYYAGGTYYGTLSNCTLAGNSATSSGGGAYYGTLTKCTLMSNSASYGGGTYYSTLNNCTLTGNSAVEGGGAYYGTLNDCTLTANSASYGGGANSATLNNCTLTGNSASSSGGGIYYGTLKNCIVYYNSAPGGANYYSGAWNYCCTTPLPSSGAGNITNAPLLASASHLSADSPCLGAGSGAYASGVDIDGEPWANPPSIGCDEYWSGSVTGALSVAIAASYTNVAVGYEVSFQALIGGRVSASRWDFGDEVVVSNQVYATHAWTLPGDYVVELRAYNETYPAGVTGTVMVQVVSQPVHYVALGSPTPTPPYSSWATAATNIQDAVDAAFPGGTVLVTNGVYETGARSVYGMSNRVAVTKSLTVRSVNGPEVTLIRGYQVAGTTNGAAAIRCVYLTNGAVLAGFTLTNGATQTSGDSGKQRSGGAVWCESTSAVVTNCVLTRNSASYYAGGTYYGTLNNCTLAGNSATSSGGGAYYGTLNNCTLTGNSASSGGGAYYGTLNNCTLTGNSASSGGGAYYGTLNNCTLTGNSASSGGGADSATLNNCIVYYNSALDGANYSDGTLNYCCTTPLPSSGTGNLTNAPLLASASHLSANSPCRGAGSAAYASGVDIDDEPWANPPSIGCDEYWSGSVTDALSVAIAASYTNVAVGYEVSFQALIGGRVSASRWDFGDGVVASNQVYATHAWSAPGDYVVELRAYNETYPAGVTGTVMVQVVSQPVHYVALGSPTPTPPYSSWGSAATNIQDAVDAATLPGALVLVTNGVYATGARAVYGMSNRVAVTKSLTVRSVNGPEVTLIRGYQVAGTTNGAAAIRCVYLTNGAVLAGFTLTNGATQTSGDSGKQRSGGAVWCESTSAVVTNCVLTRNSASYFGGGTYYGTINNCTLNGNWASFGGGGAYSSTLNNCALNGDSASSGGGTYYGALNNCTLTGNSASSGGGAYYGTLNNCVLTANSASSSGGGAYSSTLNNCTLTGNSASYGGGANSATLNNCTLTGNSASSSGGGIYYGTLKNCIVYYNNAPDGANYYSYYSGTWNYCCTTPLPSSGTGNLTNAPLLASASHLSADSPCRGAGSAAYASGVDIDDEPWANPPSIGCDEYWSGSVTGALSVAIAAAYTNVAVGYEVSFQALIGGQVSASRWDFRDSVVVSNQVYATHAWTVPGDYVVELRAYNETYPAGVTGTVMVHVVSQPVHYVALNNPSPAPPYSSWTTAATNIQDAVDAAFAGGTVLVTNGVYATGARAVYGMSNRVAVTKLLTVRSVNGPEVTIIRGYQVPGTVNGTTATRCVYLTNGAVLAGFTLTNGATQTSGDSSRQQSGGGVCCESTSAVVTNCVLTRNSASYFGGGTYYGTLNNCTLTGNSASSGGGADSATLNNCTLTGNRASASSGYGGGSYSGTLYNCILAGNSASGGGGASHGALNNCTLTGNSASSGGGTYSSTLTNCALIGNSASSSGGGASDGTLINCTLTGNSASIGGGAIAPNQCRLVNCTVTGNSASTRGGGACYATLVNCILYYNTAAEGANFYTAFPFGGSLFSCCTAQLPISGDVNFTNAPLFVDTNSWSNLRLQSNSPCINAGNNANAPSGADLDGNARIVGGTVDVGAYEYQSPASAISYAWLQQYGLPTDGSADYADSDPDGMNNWQEWVAGTDPTNAASALRMLSLSNAVSGISASWSSVSKRKYSLERATYLGTAPAFGLVRSNLAGVNGSTTFTDTNATGPGPFFYRVRVEQ